MTERIKRPRMEALGILSECLDAPWLSGVYLREQTGTLDSLLPDFRVAIPLAEAAAGYISAVLELVDNRFDRQLLRMVADGHIDGVEETDFAALMEMANRVNRAYYEMRFAAGQTEA